MGRVFPALAVAVMIGPVLAGLWGAALPAFGHLPSAGFQGPSLIGLQRLIEWRGVVEASVLSVTTGVSATLGSLCIVVLIVSGWSGTMVFTWLQRVLSPLLSVPHAAAAFGLAFLVAPSGWLLRPAALFLGWERPPDMLVVGDPLGLTMTAGLIAKEVPFLLLMTLAALPQADSQKSNLIVQSLGYGRVTGWLKSVFPRVYAQIRLPVYVVLAYSMSVVDVAMILGPTTPPTLSVQIVEWMGSPNLSNRLTAGAGAIWQLVLVLAALLVWRAVERLCACLGRKWAGEGQRDVGDAPARAMGFGFLIFTSGAVLLGLAVVGLWSIAGFWRFPAMVPDTLTLAIWTRHSDDLAATVADTFVVAGIAVAIAMILTVGCLETEYRRRRPMTPAAVWLLYAPLLVPQTAFLPGLQTLLLSFGADTGRAPVVFAHLVFVLPYVFLSLGDPWRAWDTRYATTAAAMGASSTRVLVFVRFPMLVRPLLTAIAIGLAVSVGQYLPTLLIGGGRVATLTTEAVALASGGDRRAIGVFAVAQTLAALFPFALALAVPALVFANRRGMHV